MWFPRRWISDPMYIPHGSQGGRYQILCIYHMVPWVVDIRSYVYTMGYYYPFLLSFFYDDLLYLNLENKTNADLDYGIMLHSFIIGTSHFGRQPQKSWSWSYGSWINNNLCNQCISKHHQTNKQTIDSVNKNRQILTSLCHFDQSIYSHGDYIFPFVSITGVKKVKLE